MGSRRGQRLDLTITVQKVWANRMPKISLFSPREVTLNAVATDESYRPDGKPYAVTLKTPHAGLHRVESRRWRRLHPHPVACRHARDDRIGYRHGRRDQPLPRGMDDVLLRAARHEARWRLGARAWPTGRRRVSGKLLDAEGRDGPRFRPRSEEGWFKVPVPEGQDGRLWKFDNSQGQRLLDDRCRRTLPRSAEELLLPARWWRRTARGDDWRKCDRHGCHEPVLARVRHGLQVGPNRRAGP